MISPLAYIDKDSKIGENVTIYPFAYIDKDVVIGDNNVVMPYCSILRGARIGNNNTFYQGSIISAVPQDFKYNNEDTTVEIGDNNVFREYSVISKATTPEGKTSIGDRNFIMQAARLSHDTHIGNDCIIGNASQISGNTYIDDHSILCSNVLMKQDTHVGEWSFVQGGCRFSQDIPPYIVAAMEPICYHGVNAVILKNNGFDEKNIKHINSAYRLVFQSHTTDLEEVCRQIKDQIPASDEIDKIVNFLLNSKIGII